MSPTRALWSAGAPAGPGAPRHEPSDLASVVRERWVAALASVAVLAAAAAVDPLGLHPFTTLRVVLVAVAVVVAAACAWSWRGRLPWSVVVTWAAFVSWMAVSTIWGSAGWVGLVGHPRRMFGLLAWVVCALAMVVGVALSGRGRRTLAWAFAVAGALTGVAAIAERAGWTAVGDGFGERVGGLLGQPAHLGAIGVLLVPVTIGLALEVRDRTAWLRWSLWGAAGAALVAVLLSQTRGAWLGLAVAVVVWVGAQRSPTRWHRTRRPLVVVTVVGLAVVVLVAGPVGDRVRATFESGGSATGRIDEWVVASAVLAQHPFVGVGPEGYRIEVPATIDDDYAREHGREVMVDRAHSGPLDVAVTGGLPALAAYLALLAVVGRRVWRARRDPSPIVAGMAVAVIGYAIQQLVLFPLAEVDPLVWLLAGSVLVAGERSQPGGARRRGAGPIVLAVVAAGLAVLGAVAVAADHRAGAASRLAAHGRVADALAHADAALASNPLSPDAWYLASSIAASAEAIVDVDRAIALAEEGLGWSPRDPALLDLRSALLTERALRSGLPEDLDAAIEATSERIVLDPSNPRHHLARGRVRWAVGDFSGARADLERAAWLDPGAPDVARALAGLDAGR
jgi:O-antigen ligase